MQLYERFDRQVVLFVNALRIWRLRLLGCVVGKKVRSFGRFLVVGSFQKLVIGNDVTLNEGVILNCAESLVIGNRCRISSHAQIQTSFLDSSVKPLRHVSRPVILGCDVWIASGAVISAGVRIGDRSVIGASSVVLHDVPADVLCAGNPAKIIRKIDGAETDDSPQ
jgi:acetyltransferase-like isoleucine patch superfamily enzyme